MKFRNKKNQEIVEANTYTQVFAYSHNSNWEKVEEKVEKKVEEKVEKTKKTASKEE